jgi:hypothetical protein
MRNLLVIAAIVIGGFLVIHAGKVATAPDPPPHGHSNSTAITLKTMQTYRTVTVTPDAVDCGSYRRGVYPNKSNGAMGFPNGTCAVGDRVKGKDPIKITYNGMQGYVYVHALAPMQQWRAGGGPLHRHEGAARVQPVHGAELQPGEPRAHADHRQQLVRRELPARARVLRLPRQLPA